MTLRRSLPLALLLALLPACEGDGELPGAHAGPSASYWDDPAFDGVEHLDSPPAPDPLLGARTIHSFDLQLPPAAAVSLASQPTTWVHGGFGHRTTHFGDVGLRLKGFLGSFRGLDDKAAWKVSFDRWVDGQDVEGQHGVTLNNMVQDPSCLREWLGYQLLTAAGLPVPRTSHAEVRVNNELFGLYLVVESPDDDFLDRWFPDGAGNLYDIVWFDDLGPGGEAGYALDEAGGQADRADLRALIDAVQAPLGPGWLGGLEPVLDVDRFVTMMAADSLLGHWDGYGYNTNNYRIHCAPDGLCTFLPWGIDQTWNELMDPLGQVAVLAARCTADLECRGRYLFALQRLVDLWRATPLHSLAENRAAELRPAFLRDPRREADVAAFDGAVAYLLDVIDTQPDRAQEWLNGL